MNQLTIFINCEILYKNSNLGLKIKILLYWGSLGKNHIKFISSSSFQTGFTPDPSVPFYLLTPMTFLHLASSTLLLPAWPCRLSDPRKSVFAVSMPTFVLHVGVTFHVYLRNEIGSMLELQVIFVLKHTFQLWVLLQLQNNHPA